jgi:hypothetical protein
MGAAAGKQNVAMMVALALLLLVYALVIGLNRRPSVGVSVASVMPNDADAVVASLFGAGAATTAPNVAKMAPNVAAGATIPGAAAVASVVM